ncbi:hypothetical protein TNCV_1001931 [Trichonephila clavipes]|nr:hypothetical protein TNCV_1001931 [Trichonephila clavipes]
MILKNQIMATVEGVTRITRFGTLLTLATKKIRYHQGIIEKALGSIFILISMRLSKESLIQWSVQFRREFSRGQNLFGQKTLSVRVHVAETVLKNRFCSVA